MDTSREQNVFPTLETKRLVLRPITIEDTDFIFQHFSDTALNQFLMDEPPVTEYSQAQEIVKFYVEPSEKTYNRWIIIRKTDLQPIGTCGYHKWDKRYYRAEIGYDLSPKLWGEGYMSEALREAITYGYGQMELNRVEALVYVENHRSISLLKRLGFIEEGMLRDYFYLNGIFYDHYLFALLQREWKPEGYHNSNTLQSH